MAKEESDSAKITFLAVGTVLALSFAGVAAWMAWDVISSIGS